MTPPGQAPFSAAFIVSNHVLAGACGARISTTSDGSWKQKSEILKYLLFSFQQALTAKMPPAILWIFALKAQVAPIIEALPFSSCPMIIERPDNSAIRPKTKYDRSNLRPSRVFSTAIDHFGLVHEVFLPANKSYSCTS